MARLQGGRDAVESGIWGQIGRSDGSRTEFSLGLKHCLKLAWRAPEGPSLTDVLGMITSASSFWRALQVRGEGRERGV